MTWLPYLAGAAAIAGALLLLVWKAELRLRWALPWALLIAPCCLWLARRLSLVILGVPFGFQVLAGFVLALAASVFTVLLLFFRDPHRTPPQEPGTILSPADGKIIYIKALDNDTFPIAVKKGKDIPLEEFTGEEIGFGAGIQIGIMMSYLDVHVNRAPIAGTVERLRRIPGSFLSLKHMDSLLENERVFSIIRGPEDWVGIVQIASRMVRRIVPFIKEGEDVRQGDRIGAIRFGSQVDILMPNRDDIIVQARVGDYVKAGLSVLAKHKSPSRAQSV